jgi:hypothetical protein
MKTLLRCQVQKPHIRLQPFLDRQHSKPHPRILHNLSPFGRSFRFHWKLRTRWVLLTFCDYLKLLAKDFEGMLRELHPNPTLGHLPATSTIGADEFTDRAHLQGVVILAEID